MCLDLFRGEENGRDRPTQSAGRIHTQRLSVGKSPIWRAAYQLIYTFYQPPALADLTQKSLEGDSKPRPLVRMSVNMQILRTAPLANLLQKSFGWGYKPRSLEAIHRGPSRL